MERSPVPQPRRACPHLEGFDPLDPAQNTHPYPALERARHDVPIFYVPSLRLWFVTRHEDVRAVFRDPQTFSNADEHDVTIPMPKQLAGEVPDGWQFPLFAGSSLNVNDPPAHTRLRKLMQFAFTPRRLNARTDRIREIADALIDDFEPRGGADLMTDFATPLVTRVIAEILGIPREYTDRFFHWADNFFRITGARDLPEDETIELWRGLIECDRFLRDFVAERRQAPRDDLGSDLIHARTDDGDPAMTDEELVANIVGLAVAGSDTTAVLIAHTMYLLGRHPEQYAAVRDDRSLIPNAVEETMRLMGPVRGLRRTATRDVELGGIRLSKGDMLFVHTGSAGRDEEVFEDANDFDIRRPNSNEHLGFGIWTHFCIGAPLARLEARIALEQLLERLPELRLADDLRELEYSIALRVPSVRALPVKWTPA